MKINAHLIATIAALSPTTFADWQYKSRPDLSPPCLNITIANNTSSQISSGYLFVAPFAGNPPTKNTAHYGPRQPGPYIFRDNGELVWSGYSYYSIWTTNFQAGRWDGQDVLFAFEGDHNANYGHGHGHATFLDQHYETVRELRAGKHKLMDKHEFHIIDETTALIQIYQPVPRDLTAFGAKPEQQWIVNAIIQELDISTGKVLFEWKSLDHVSPSESVLPITKGQAGSGYNSSDAWDYFHINSVDKDAEGNYIVSARDACAVHKINGTSGEIIWRLNGKKSDFEMGENSTFCFQHHARWLNPQQYGHHEAGVEVISLYDNAAHGTENDSGDELHTNSTSSGKILRLNTTASPYTASLVRGFYPPDGTNLLSKSQGSTQILPNGNALVNWGSEGAATEYTPDGTPIFHAHMDSGSLGEGVQNYRAFKYPWTGRPREEPALAVHWRKEQDRTAIFVSWNGDTETVAWRFYNHASEAQDGRRALLGEVKRNGFETEFVVEKHAVVFASAEAVDREGNVLVRSAIVEAEDEVRPLGGVAEVKGAWEQEVLGTHAGDL